MAFYDAKPKDEVIKRLKEERDQYEGEIISIDSIFSNDTNISKRQLSYMSIQSAILNSLVDVLDERIEDLEENDE